MFVTLSLKEQRRYDLSPTKRLSMTPMLCDACAPLSENPTRDFDVDPQLYVDRNLRTAIVKYTEDLRRAGRKGVLKCVEDLIDEKKRKR